MMFVQKAARTQNGASAQHTASPVSRHAPAPVQQAVGESTHVEEGSPGELETESSQDPARESSGHERHFSQTPVLPPDPPHPPIQAKLAQEDSEDPLEREADRIADEAALTDERLARAGLAAQIKPLTRIPAAIRVSPPSNLESIVASPGSALEPALRRDMEKRFGYDFSRVRIHAGAAAAHSADEIRARAYTVGKNIVFGAGQFAPSSQKGRRLLAHELTHVVQQSALASPPGSASPAAHNVQSAGGGSRSVQAAGPGVALQRDAKEDSARLEGDSKTHEILVGASALKFGDTGLAVTKLQEVLIELKYLPATDATGLFGPATRLALKKFQTDKSIPSTGEFDQATITEINAIYDTRKPYIDNAKLDALHRGTHKLSATDKSAAVAALVPAPVPGAATTFQEDLGTKGKYGPRMRAQLNQVIKDFHKDTFEDKAPLRADPAKNFHGWAVLEAPAAAAKNVVDAVYDTNYGGASATSYLTNANGHLVDQWADELARDAPLTDDQKKAKARGKVWYLINSNCEDINREHTAVPSNPSETAILTPIVEACISSPAKVQTLLDLETGWEGAQLEGTVYLQQYKSTDPDVDAAKEANRVQMWSIFETCIHEYIHTLAHKKFNDWAQQLKDAGDETRYNTLVEGFCDFFTLNVRSTLNLPSVQAKVEGPYANGNPPEADHSGVYASNEQAEQVVSIVGIKNAQAAYFEGKTELMGGPPAASP